MGTVDNVSGRQHICVLEELGTGSSIAQVEGRRPRWGPRGKARAGSLGNREGF